VQRSDPRAQHEWQERARDDGDEEQRRGHRSKDNGIARRVTVMYAVPGISSCKRRRSGSMKRRA
jgi:hypothetical protein